MTTTPVHGDPEKQGGVIFSDLNVHGGHKSHIQEAREKLQHFLHPNGQRIHVVDSPQDEANLRRKLTHAAAEQEQEFNIYISGSAEHLEALRSAHAHHEERKERLKKENQEIYERFAAVHNDLDLLSHELDRVTTHGVSLEAHFSKFGYDAHIKTYDDESPPGSGATTPRSSISAKSGQAKCEIGYGKPLKLFQVPVLRQYFHKGTLWRSSGAEEVQSFELFVDLLYVGIIAINGDQTSEDPTAFSLLRFVITFTLSWKIWNDMTLIISWFETDDLFQRVSIIMLLAILFGYTTNITRSFDGTYETLVAFYVAARLFMSTYLVLVAYLVPMIRNVMFIHVAAAVVGGAIWIGSIYVPYPASMGPIWAAIIVDMIGPIVLLSIRSSSKIFGSKFGEWFDQKFQFWPAVNIEHRTERMNAFVTLVFGYSVVALLYQSTANGVDAHYGKGVLGLTQAFCFNWMYFEIDGSNLHVHAIRRHRYSAVMWAFNHLPFIMAFVLGSAGLSRLVLAVDTPDSHLDGLTETYRLKAEEVIPPGIRWFYCAGYAIALALMGGISMCHIHKEIPTIRLRKRWRLVLRFGVCLIMLLLPLAKSLNSLQLVGVMTGLIVFALFIEHWCATCRKQKLCARSKPCKYVGNCSKKEMDALVKQGKAVDIEQLGSRHRNSGLALCQ